MTRDSDLGGELHGRNTFPKPMRVIAKKGNRVDLRTAGVSEACTVRQLVDVHLGDLLLVPPDAADPGQTRPIVTLQEDPEKELVPRSPGMMIEQRDAADAEAKGIVKARQSKRTSKGKLASLREGSYIAYM